MVDPILRLYERRFDERPTAVVAVAADGSQRQYRRLVASDGSSVIGAFGPDADENRAYLSFSRAFRSIDLPVPEIYAADESAGVWLEEDLGDTTLFDALSHARDRTSEFPDAMLEVYRRVLEALPRFQIDGGRVVDFDVAYPHAAFDRQSIAWDLNYFKYHFLKLAHVPFHEARLERDFEALTGYLLDTDTSTFLYRDFQSRNVMLRDGEPWFIDYQGGRRGALHYDVASLLYDAKADLPEPVRTTLLDHYLDALGERIDVDRGAFRERYRAYVIVRILQAMGAYGYRGFFERRPRFLASVPFAARNLDRLLDRGLPLELPELATVFRRIVDEWAGDHPDDGDGLTVLIHSFSYRRGYPHDLTGHGGGYVFDCRALPNPGRLEEHRETTGLDPEVVEWLEERPELAGFWDHTRALVDAQVDRYLERGFSRLTVCYGCTGGQHRSVYFAERLGRHLRNRDDVGVRIVHREESSWPRRPAAVATEA